MTSTNYSWVRPTIVALIVLFLSSCATPIKKSPLFTNLQEKDQSEKDQALCLFAEKLTLDQQEIGPGDLESLRVHGFEDTAIHDATQIIGYFNYITRIADALGVEPESDIGEWGLSNP